MMLVDELLIHISTLASIYHRPPDTFIGGFKPRSQPQVARNLESRIGDDKGNMNISNPYANNIAPKPAVNLNLGNLLDLDDEKDIGASGLDTIAGNDAGFSTGGGFGGHDSIPGAVIHGGVPMPGLAGVQKSAVANISNGMANISMSDANRAVNHSMDDLGGVFGSGSTSGGFVPEKGVFLSAQNGRGLEIMGTFARRQGQIIMEMVFTNRALQPLGDFAIQFNKNTYVATFCFKSVEFIHLS